MSDGRKGNFEITWPLYDADPGRQFPVDPRATLSEYAVPSAALLQLSERTDVPDSSAQDEQDARKLRESMPPAAAEWMRAAQILVNALTGLIERGSIDTAEHAALARAWAAWSMGGASDAHVLRVAHLVSRAHAAIHQAAHGSVAVDPERVILDCAKVLHAGLPSAIRARMPFERAVLVVRQLQTLNDPWAAVVEGTAELLGWKDYARIHAASIIRAVIEQRRS